MCVGGPPKPPPLPPPRPTAPPPEKTAKNVGQAGPVKKKKQQGTTPRPRGGTSSLKIQPLNTGSNTDLNL